MLFFEGSCFPDVEDGKIALIPFLEASKGIVKFVDLLGKVFLPVKHDINGNIEKLYNVRNSNKEKFITLNDIIEHELNESPKIGIEALLWLKRALEYIHMFLTCLVNDSKEGKCTENLAPFFHKAYEEKLKPYHGWLVQKLFGFIVHAAPSRKALLKLLAGENTSATEEEIIADADNYLKNLTNNLNVINELYQLHNLDSNQKV